METISDFNRLLEEANDPNTERDRMMELAAIAPQFARVVARNPCAPPELLQQLS
ncbi:MAG: hypothetical protein SW833_06120 [Cyanobacteriota bacterium]|nr:hypothetical protein [Cyanobacteriota bacterium]